MLQIGEKEGPGGIELYAELFPDFASKGLLEPFAGLDSAARKGPLPRVDTAVARHLAKQDRTVVTANDGDDDEASGNI